MRLPLSREAFFYLLSTASIQFSKIAELFGRKPCRIYTPFSIWCQLVSWVMLRLRLRLWFSFTSTFRRLRLGLATAREAARKSWICREKVHLWFDFSESSRYSPGTPKETFEVLLKYSPGNLPSTPQALPKYSSGTLQVLLKSADLPERRASGKGQHTTNQPTTNDDHSTTGRPTHNDEPRPTTTEPRHTNDERRPTDNNRTTVVDRRSGK